MNQEFFNVISKPKKCLIDVMVVILWFSKNIGNEKNVLNIKLKKTILLCEHKEKVMTFKNKIDR